MLTPEFLAYVRIFEYLMVIIAALFLSRKFHNAVYTMNVVIASMLCFNAIQFIIGIPNAQAFQAIITILIGIWALAHVLELIGRNK